MLWHFITALFLHTVFAVCPDGWQRHEQSCYLFSHGREDWPGAFEMCKLMGGQLVEIETVEENAFLQQQIVSYGHHFWIGLSDASEQGNWVWMTSKTPVKEQFTKWQPGEPSTTDANHEPENCADFYYTNGNWNDAACWALNYYMCEKKDVPSQIVG